MAWAGQIASQSLHADRGQRLKDRQHQLSSGIQTFEIQNSPMHRSSPLGYLRSACSPRNRGETGPASCGYMMVYGGRKKFSSTIHMPDERKKSIVSTKRLERGEIGKNMSRCGQRPFEIEVISTTPNVPPDDGHSVFNHRGGEQNGSIFDRCTTHPARIENANPISQLTPQNLGEEEHLRRLVESARSF